MIALYGRFVVVSGLLGVALIYGALLVASPLPDHDVIAFTRRQGNRTDVYLLNVNYRILHNFSRSEEMNEFTPQWSRDGRYLAYLSQAPAGGTALRVYGSASRQILEPVRQHLITQGFAYDWSPESDSLVITAHLSLLENRGFDLWRVSWDGAVLENLTNAEGNYLQPRFSLDGDAILYTFRSESGTDVYRFDVNNGMRTRLTENLDADGDALWSPDGEQIVFESWRDGHYEIYLMNRDGTGLRNLTNHPESDTEARFSPDGTRILFLGIRDGDRHLYTLELATGRLRQLTDVGNVYGDAAWSSDGSRIVFRVSRTGGEHLMIVDADGRNLQALTADVSGNYDYEPVWQP